MGGCASKADGNDGTKNIDNALIEDRRNDARVMKILLLGAGDSGKTTIFKQMKILHQNGYTEAERKAFSTIIHTNCQQNMKDLLKAMERLGTPIPSSLDSDVEFLNARESSNPLNPETAAVIKRLWSDDAIRTAYKRRSEFQLADSAAYYFGDVDRLSEVGYTPTLQDILRARSRTTGIVETAFELDRVKFRMYDVGGQRNERRKWIHCFDNVHAVLFVAAISEYDQVLYEDDSQNRMHEALSLFSEICNSRFFAETAMILFLNKRDLFQEKINAISLKACFPDYNLPDTYEAGVSFITQKFIAMNKNAAKQIYVHVTCATDTSNIDFVFNAVKDIVLTLNLRGSGFI